MTRTTETDHLREATYQGRWACTAGYTIEEGWALWQGTAAREGWDPAVGWPLFVDAFQVKASE